MQMPRDMAPTRMASAMLAACRSLSIDGKAWSFVHHHERDDEEKFDIREDQSSNDVAERDRFILLPPVYMVIAAVNPSGTSG